MKKLIRNIIVWAFEGKTVMSSSSFAQRFGEIYLDSSRVSLTGCASTDELEALKDQVNMLTLAVEGLKENTTAENSDVMDRVKSLETMIMLLTEKINSR